MKNWWDKSVKPVLLNLLKFIFQSNEDCNVQVIEQIRKKYEGYGYAKLKNILVANKSQLQSTKFTFTGIIIVLFTALLGGFGNTIIKWINQLMIVSTSSDIKAIHKLSITNAREVLIIDGLVVVSIIFLLVLGLASYIDRIKYKQTKILIIEDILKDEE